jgi:hypothetical protein
MYVHRQGALDTDDNPASINTTKRSAAMHPSSRQALPPDFIPATSGEYRDEPTSPGTYHTAIPSRYRDRDSLDMPPRGYSYATGADPHEDEDNRGYSDPFASRTGAMGDEVFNVEDDFNNVGPRYAEVYGTEKEEKDAAVAGRAVSR